MAKMLGGILKAARSERKLLAKRLKAVDAIVSRIEKAAGVSPRKKARKPRKDKGKKKVVGVAKAAIAKVAKKAAKKAASKPTKAVETREEKAARLKAAAGTEGDE